MNRDRSLRARTILYTLNSKDPFAFPCFSLHPCPPLSVGHLWKKSICMISLKIYLLILNDRMRGEITHWLFYSPNGCNRQRWSKLKVSLELYLGHSYWVIGVGASTWIMFSCFLKYISMELDQKKELLGLKGTFSIRCQCHRLAADPAAL